MTDHPTPNLPVYFGPAMVAQWLGVSRDTVSNWLRRYGDLPEPAGLVQGPQRVSLFWRGEQRRQWLHWAHSHDVHVLTPEASDERLPRGAPVLRWPQRAN
jgi:hypothetical protein